MALPLPAETFPLIQDEAGRILIEGTRVTLDSVVYAFREGATPEEITFRFPTLALRDVYASISYYLNHTDEIDAYLGVREEAARSRREKSQQDSVAIRQRLLDRRR